MLRLLPLLLLGACVPTEPPRDPLLVQPTEEAVAARVEEAEARLQSTEGGRLVWQAIGAHGGLARWYANGPLAFTYTYQPVDGRDPIATHQVVDPWGSRAVHQLVGDTAVSFGWTGREAWVHPAGAEIGTNARFWSLTPYYFVAMPFVLADPGVRHAAEGTWTHEGKTYNLVRITFEPGTGDAPDDYYVVLLDSATHRVAGLRYVVSYPGFFPEGGHTPETIMWYTGAQTAEGITFQQGFRSFVWAESAPGEARAAGTMTGVRFVPDRVEDDFAVPQGAQVIQEM